MTNCRNHRYFSEHLFLGKERKELLEKHGWYKNLAGSYVHPRCMDFLSLMEIRSLTPAQLDYKLTHGSQSPLPEELKLS